MISLPGEAGKSSDGEKCVRRGWLCVQTDAACWCVHCTVLTSYCFMANAPGNANRYEIDFRRKRWMREMRGVRVEGLKGVACSGVIKQRQKAAKPETACGGNSAQG